MLVKFTESATYKYFNAAFVTTPSTSQTVTGNTNFTMQCSAQSGSTTGTRVYGQFWYQWNSTTQAWVNMSTSGTNAFVINGWNDSLQMPSSAGVNTTTSTSAHNVNASVSVGTYWVRCYEPAETADQSKILTNGTIQITVNVYINFTNPTFNDSNPTITEPVNFTMSVWTSDPTLSGYIFSSNMTNDGSWTNSSWISASAKSITAWNVSTVTSAGTYGWKFYANSSSNYWNVSDMQTTTFTVVYPQYSLNGTNNTDPRPNDVILHYVNWSTSYGSMSGYIFSNNYFGSWSNKTWTAFGASTWSNETNTSTAAGTYGWRVYANNSINQWNDTGIQTITFMPDIVIKETGVAYTTIQSAINAATNGQTVIILKPKWFNENVTLNKSITLTSNSSVDPTINSTATSLLINANSATVTNLIIAYNGTSTNQNTVWITGNYTTLANNTIRMRIQNTNYPVYVQNSANNTIFGNNITSQSWSNPGIYLSGSASTNNTVDSNLIAYGATSSWGIYIVANNNTIKNNNITSAGGYMPIRMFAYYDTVVINNNYYNGKPIVYNKTIQNLTITATTYGELILGNSFNVTINNSAFTEGGILFLRTTNSAISNSNITTKTEAILLDDSSTYNTIFNNNISTSAYDRSYGITINWGCDYTNITKNNITVGNVDDWSYNFGIYGQSSYNTITSNSIKTYSTYGNGIVLVWPSSYNKITNTNITTSGQASRGIWLAGSYSNNITSCNITTTGSSTTNIDANSESDYIPSAIHIGRANNNIISDCILNATNYYDVFVSGTSNEINYIIKSTFNKTDIMFNQSSNTKLYNQYYLDVYVNDTFGNPLNSASVLIMSKNYPVSTSALAGYWHFDEGSGTTASDSSGNGNTGTLYNSPNVSWTTGKFGSGVSFNSSGGNFGYIEISGAGALKNVTNSSFTFEAWVKPYNSTHSPDYNSIVTRTGYHTALGYLTNWEMFSMDMYNSTNYHFYAPTQNAYSNGDWYHVVGVVNDAEKKIYIYVNGVLAGTGSYVGPLKDYGTANYYVGAGQNYSNQWNYTFNGTIDEVQIWNRSLTQDEITELYNSRNGYGIQTNSSGYIPQQTLSEFMGNWTYNSTTGYLYFTNYTVNASATGFTSSSATVNLTSSKLVVLTLTDNQGPQWSSNTTSLVSRYSTTTLSHFNITWTDSSAVSTAFFESNFSGSPTNYTMTKPNSNYNYNTTLPAGSFYWKFFANDTLNNWNVSNTWYFTVGKAKPVLILNNNTVAVNSSGLVGYWRFENESLGYATDYSGWNNTGTLTNMNNAGNATSGPTAGRFGGGMQFDGVNDYVSVPHQSYFTQAPFTAEAWVKFNQLATGKNEHEFVLVKKHSVSPYSSWSISMRNSSTSTANKIRFAIYNSTSNYVYVDSNSAATTNVWYHIVVRLDENYNMRLFINGVQQSETDNSGSLFNSNSTLLIGSDLTSSRTNGTVDEVQIWNRSLTADEVNELYQSKVTYGTQTNFTFSEQNTGDSDVNYDFFRNSTVAGIWHFDEGSGNTAVDSSGNGNTGTLNTNVSWTTGRFGSAASFNGSVNSVTVPHSSLFVPSNGVMTVAAWVKFSDLNTIEDIVNKGWNRVWLFRYSDNKVSFRLNNSVSFSVGSNLALTSNNLGNWYYIVGTYDGNVIRIYINGTLDNSNTVGALNLVDVGDTLEIGSQQKYAEFFNGTIDEVRIYPRALTAAEILCLYENNCTQAGFNNETNVLPAGYHYYSARASGGQNYTISSLLLPLNITPLPNPIDIYFINSTGTYKNQNMTVSTGTQITANATMTNSNGGTANLYLDNSLVSNPNTTTLSGGIHSFTGNTTGAQNYSANSTTYYVTVGDFAAPQWQNQGTNDTDNSILQGEAINLTAQGKDETALDWSWLSTNESGSWKNYTAGLITTFNDSTTAKNISFSAAGSNVSVWIKLPKNINVTSAKVNVSGYQQSSSPFVYSWDGSEYVYETDILAGFDSKEKENISTNVLMHMKESKIKIANNLDEIEYINLLKLKVTTGNKIIYLKPVKISNNNLQSILEDDQDYLVLNKGDEYFVEFESLPTSVNKIELIANGYYVGKEEGANVDTIKSLIKTFGNTEIGDVNYPTQAISNAPIEIISASLSKKDVKPGDILTVKVEVKSDFGIKEITADIGGIENITLQHIAGNIYSGTWQKDWLVHSTEVKNYTVTLFVRDNAGNEIVDKSLEFSDPSFGFTSTGSTSYPTTTAGTTSGTAAIGYANYWLVYKVVVSNPLTVTSLTGYVAGGATPYNMRWAIWQDNAGYPGALWNDFGETAGTGSKTVTISANYMPAGSYWFGYNIPSSGYGLGGTDGAVTGETYYVGSTYGAAPNPYPAGGTQTLNTWHMNVYVTGAQIKNYAKATKVTLSDNNAIINSMSLYSHSTGNFRLAIYNDSSGPSSKLLDCPSTAATTGWNTVSISSCTPTSLTLNSGTYWFAWQWDSVNSGPSYTTGNSGDGNYIAQTYGTFPSTWSGGTSSSEKWSVYANYTLSYNASNVALNLGNTGVNDWSMSGQLNSTNSPQTANLNITKLNQYLSTCTADAQGYCTVPINVTSDTAGIVQLNALNIQYTFYNSPMNMTKNNQWQWSNFTWSNSSINRQRIGWRIYYNDTAGNENVTDIQTFTVGDLISPIWQNQGTNDTDNIILQGQAINLTAQGKDETALDWAWLSTNESGSWRNYTTIYNWTQTSTADFNAGTKVNTTESNGNIILNRTTGTWTADTTYSSLWCTQSSYVTTNCANLFDDNNATRWEGSGGAPQWFTVNYTASNPKTITRVECYEVDYSPGVTNATLYGSNTYGSGWVPLVTNIKCNSTSYGVGYTFTNTISYQFYNFTINAYSGSTDTTLYEVSLKENTYYSTGNFESQIYDSGSTQTWQTLSWNETLASGTDICGQVAVNNTGSWIYSGLSCTPPVTLSVTNSRFIKANFTLNTTNSSFTPTLSDFNITYKTYNSPMNMTKDSNWQWSNFTWSNSSVAQGTTVGWKIYYNDTSGNENVTDVNTFRIIDTVAPTITIQSPLNATYNSSSQSYNIWANVTLNKAGSWCGVSLDGAANNSLSNSTGNWNYLMSSVASGSHNVIVYCNNTEGYMGNSSTRYFTLNTPPIWQNQGTNDTDNIINQGEGINLTAQGKDETALDWSWLSTNESGSWRNITSANNWTQTSTTDFNAGTSVNTSANNGNMILNTINSTSPNTQVIADTSNHEIGWIGGVICHNFTANTTGQVTTVGLNVYTAVGNIRVAVYANNASNNYPGTLLGESSSLAAATNWNDLAVGNVYITNGVVYWLCLQVSDNTLNLYDKLTGMTGRSAVQSYGAFPNPIVTTVGNVFMPNMRINYNQTRYYTSGSFESQIYDAGVTQTWQTLNWNETITQGTDICGQVAVNNTGSWVYSGLECTPPITLSIANSRFIKANFTLNTTNTSNTPTLSDFNITYKTYNSPMSMTKNNQWQWSNFTWSNSSVAGGTAVGWKIYYNDTSNNQNVTDIQTFLIRDSTPPQWSSNSTNIVSTYSPTTSSQFNITWTDNIAVDKVFIESNFSGSPYNYTPSIDGNVRYLSAVLPAGNFYWRSFANDSSNNWNVSYQWNFTVAKAKPVLTLNNNTVAVNTSGLAGYWRFENESLGTATDYSGWNNTGTVTNAIQTNGIIGNAYNFDPAGGYDHIDIKDSSSLNTPYLTGSLWIKIPSYQSWERVLSKYYYYAEGSKGSWVLMFDDTGKLYAAFNMSTWWDGVTSDSVIPLNTWTHVAFTSNGTHATIYVNGKTDGTKYTGVGVWVNPYPYKLCIGVSCNGTDSQNAFNGTLDEIMLFNRSLSTDEVAELYQSQVTYGTQTNFTLSEQNTGDADVNYDFFRNGTVAGMWHFDEGSGNTTVDSSGNGNKGTLTNMNTTGNATSGWNSTDCKYGSCLKFDGVDDYVDVGNANSLNITDAITISAWIKAGDVTTDGGLTRRIVTKTVYLLAAGDKAFFRVINTTDGDNSLSYTWSSADIGVWHHIVGTYDSNGGTNNLRLYQDGVLVNSATRFGKISTNVMNVIIGRHSASSGRFNGTIDEVRIYPRALSSAEILCHYGNNCTQAGFNNETNVLPAGYHYYSAYTAGGQNYTQSALLLPLNVTKANANVQVSPASQNITYGTSITPYCTASGAACTLYRNDTVVSNNTQITLAAGVYTYKANISDSFNYTNWESGTSTITVAKANPVLIMNNGTVAVNTSGLVGYWRFENESLGTATDYSGWNNTGTLTNMNNAGNATSGPTGGRFGKGMQFDGVNDLVSIQHQSYFTQAPFTAVTWVKFNQLATDKNEHENILSKKHSDTPYNSWWVRITNSSTSVANKLTFYVVDSGSGYHDVYSDSPVITDVWYQVVVTLDSSYNMKLYVNGIQQADAENSGDMFNSDSYLRIGANTNSQSRFNGTIDEAQIWNRSLTSDEIKELYESRVQYPTQTSFSKSDNTNGQITTNLYRNTTSVSSPDTQTLGANYYYYLANTSGNANYTQAALLLPLNITKGTVQPDLFVNGTDTWSYQYPVVTSVTCNLTQVDGGSGPSCSLWRDDVSKGTSETTQLPVGSYVYRANSSETTNYTVNETGQTHTLTITSGAAPTLYLAFNGTVNANAVYTYPQAVNATAYFTGPSEGTVVLWRNGTNLGNATTVSSIQSLGNATWNFTVSYYAQNYSVSSITYYVYMVKGVLAGSISGSDVMYPTAVNVIPSESNGGDSDTNYYFYRNNTLVSQQTGSAPSADTTQLGAANYLYVLNASSGTNYTANVSITTKSINVNQNNTNPVNLYFNGTANANRTYTYPQAVNATAVALYSSSGTIFLYRNETQKASGTSPQSENILLGNGTYVYKVNITGNANYSSNATGLTYYVFVSKGAVQPDLFVNGTDTWSYQYPVVTSVTCNLTQVDGGSGPSCSLWRDDVSKGTSETTQLPVGNYIYRANSSETANYTVNASGQTHTLTITSGVAPTLYLAFNGTANSNAVYTYPAVVNATAYFTGPSEGTVVLWRNGTNLGNASSVSSIQPLGNATWNFTVSYYAQNYSASSITYYVYMNKGMNPIDIYFINSTGTYKNQNITTSLGGQTTANATMVNSNAGTVSLYQDNSLISNPNTTILSIGVHSFTGNTTGNQNYTANNTGAIYYVTVNPSSNPVTLTISPGNVTYPTATNVTCLSTYNSANLYKNDSLATENNTAITLGAAAYLYTCNVSASGGYPANTTSLVLVISENTTNPVNLYFNGIANANRTYVYPSIINATGEAIYSGSGTVNLYRGTGSAIAGAQENILLGNGTYAYKVNITGNQNYTSNTSGLMFYVLVNKGTVQPDLFVNDTDSWSYQYPTVTSVTCNLTQVDGGSGPSCSLWRDDVSKGTSETTQLPVGNYVYRANSSETANYTVNTTGQTHTLTITSGVVPTVTVTFDKTSSQTYVPGINLGIQCDVNREPSILQIYRNNTMVKETSSNATQLVYNDSIGGGLWNYSCYYLASQNYSAASSINNNFVVNKASTTASLLLNGTNLDATYAYGDVANMTTVLSVAGKTAKLATNFTGWFVESGPSPFADLKTLNYNSATYNVTGYFEGDENYTGNSAMHYISIGVKLTFNITSASSPLQQLSSVKFFVMDAGKSYTDFAYQKKYSITSDTEPTVSYTFTKKDMLEGRDIRFEVPTSMGMMQVMLYNVTPNTTASGIVPIRIIAGENYTGPNPITGSLSYIFFINDTLLNYSSYNIKVPFNRTRMGQPNKFLRCLEFNWDTNMCNLWNVTDTAGITDTGSNYTFTTKKVSLKCSPALADTAMHGSSYQEMYGGMTSSFSKLYFDDFEFGYGGWQAEGGTNAYPYPSDSYSGSSTAGYSLKVEYVGSSSSGSKARCENWEVQNLCAPPSNYTNSSGCSSGWFSDNGQDDAARAEANTSFANNCNMCCGGSGTFVPYSSSPYREPWNSTATPYRYHSFGDCICTSGTASGYAAKNVNYNTKSYKFIGFSYKVPATSKMDMKVFADNIWYTYNGTASQGDFIIPGFKADEMWHTATISMDRDLDNITQCSSPCNHQITQIKFGSDSGVAGQRFYIDDFAVTNEMGAAAKTFYEADFEKPYQISEWYGGQQQYQGYFSAYSLKVPTSITVTKSFGYFGQDYNYIDFAYKTVFSSPQTFTLRIMSRKLQDNYYTSCNTTEIQISASPTTWTNRHISLSSYGLQNSKVERIEFVSQSGDVWIDNFFVSSEAAGECTNCNITVGSVQFNTKYFSDFEYGAGGWIPAGGSAMVLGTTNTTSYSGMSSLMLSNNTNLVANFTPGYVAPSVSTASYPYMSFAYKATSGVMKYKIGSSWYNIPGFVADNAWHNVTINLAGYGPQITNIAIGNSSTTSGATFYIDDFVISSNRPESCPYVDERHDITFNMRAGAGWRIDAGSGQAKPDVFVIGITLNNTTALNHNDFVIVNVSVGNQGNASTGGGNDAVQVDCYLDNVLVSTNYTDVLGPAPPRNESWTYCNFTALAGCHTFNVSTKIIDPPDKEEWNYTNNNESYTICTNKASAAVYLALNGTQSNKTITYPAVINATAWGSIEDSALTLWRNGTNITIGSNSATEINRLTAGKVYNYTAELVGTNYTNSVTRFLTVDIGAQLTTLQLNGTSANKDYLLNQIAEIKAFSNVTTMQTTIYANFTGSLQSIASGTGTVTNYTNTTVLGLDRYLIKANTTGNENYTSATSDSYILTVRVANVIISCEAGGPYSADAAVLVVGNVSDQGGTPLSSSVIVEIRKNGVLQTSQGITSSSEGKYFAEFGSLAAGTYVANVTTSYEGANGYCNDTFSITSIATCAEKTIGLSGYAFDYSTGQTISSGTVKVTIRETGDGKQESFSNGYWSIGFATCLTSGTKYTAAIQITDSSTGKTSYTQLEFVGR